MSLFIGNIPNEQDATEFEELFSNIGSCQVRLKGAFGFVDFDEEEHAEKAITDLNGHELQGKRIRVGWSKKSGRGGDGGGASGGSKDCFNCGKPGHMSRDCEEPKKPRESGGGGGGGARDCFNCGQSGHMSRECDQPKKPRESGGGGGGGRDCFNCGQPGHMSRECDQPRKPREPKRSRSRSGGRD